MIRALASTPVAADPEVEAGTNTFCRLASLPKIVSRFVSAPSALAIALISSRVSGSGGNLSYWAFETKSLSLLYEPVLTLVSDFRSDRVLVVPDAVANVTEPNSGSPNPKKGLYLAR